jgi:hypothetical protein
MLVGVFEIVQRLQSSERKQAFRVVVLVNTLVSNIRSELDWVSKDPYF